MRVANNTFVPTVAKRAAGTMWTFDRMKTKNMNRLYVWASFALLLAIAFLQRHLMLSATQTMRAEDPSATFLLTFPLGIHIGGLWWLFAVPGAWFVAALFMHFRGVNSTIMAMLYVVSALLGCIVLLFMSQFTGLILQAR